jgi:CBS domain-containing protein/anti-sigma regulatory factor (Ser/Thr protein kinase)
MDKLSEVQPRTLTDQDARRISRVEELAYDLKVRDIMSQKVYTVAPGEPMARVLELLRQYQISGLPVVDSGALIGVVSLEDLIRAMTALDLEAPVKQYMTRQVITIQESEAVVEAVETFTRKTIGRMPVVDATNRLVGMVTKGDVTIGLLNALQSDFQAEEVRRYRASHLFEDIHSDRTSLILRYNIQARDFDRGGTASSHIKRALVRLGANTQIARRCGIAIYEAEMNLIIHTTSGGQIRVEIEPNRILMVTTDQGPGIPDIDLAMQPGWSTATDHVRELGFGAGMGLVNIKRCVDDMKLESTPGKGTRLEMKIYLEDEESLKESRYSAGEES